MRKLRFERHFVSKGKGRKIIKEDNKIKTFRNNKKYFFVIYESINISFLKNSFVDQSTLLCYIRDQPRGSNPKIKEVLVLYAPIFIAPFPILQIVKPFPEFNTIFYKL